MEISPVALLTQRSIEEAAKSAGKRANAYAVAEATGIDAAYGAARRAAQGQTTARLQQMSGAAVLTLGKAMVDVGTPSSTRVRAAEVIFSDPA